MSDSVTPVEGTTGGGPAVTKRGDARRGRPAWLKRFMRNGAGMIGLVGVVIVLVMALGAPLLAPHDPARQYFDGLTLFGDPLPPSSEFPLGTDTLGRDLSSRILYGARVSLLVGVLANGAAVLLGLIIGVAAGYFRGVTDTILMRLTDVMTALPHVQQDTLRPIGITAGQRSAALPDLPTLDESGLSGYDVSVFFGIVGPKGLDDSIVQKLNRAFVDVMAQDEVKAVLTQQGIVEAEDKTPEALAMFIETEVDKWADVIKSANVAMD